MCKRARPSEELGCAVLGGGVLQMVSEPTLAVARTGQCADIWRMARVCPSRDTHYGIWRRHWTCERAPRGNVPEHLPMPVWVSWTDEDVGFFEGECVTSDPIWMAQ